jgi:hypothetical protein
MTSRLGKAADGHHLATADAFQCRLDPGLFLEQSLSNLGEGASTLYFGAKTEQATPRRAVTPRAVSDQ